MSNDVSGEGVGTAGAAFGTLGERLEGFRLDAAFAALILWLHVGVTYDFRQHAGGLDFAEEGFLTVPHAIFYAAFVAIAATLTAVILSNRARGDSWVEAIPTGYRFARLGVLLFGLGGPMDFLWHSAFGFEEGVEALTSPTHLLLVVGAALFVTAPLRSAWVRGLPESLPRQLPALVGAALLLNTAAIFSGYGNPILVPHAAAAEVGGTITGRGAEAAAGADGLSVTVAHGAAGMLVFSALVVGLAVTLARRFRLAPGAFALVYGITGASVAYTGGTEVFVPAMVALGVLADALYRLLRPWPTRAVAFQAFAAAVPSTMAALYFATVHLAWGIEWSTHVWAGLVAATALVGLLVSYVAMPSLQHPDLRDEERGPRASAASE
jgi:hypothetical protein